MTNEIKQYVFDRYKSPDDSFTSEYFGGKYSKTKLRNSVIEGN